MEGELRAEVLWPGMVELMPQQPEPALEGRGGGGKSRLAGQLTDHPRKRLGRQAGGLLVAAPALGSTACLSCQAVRLLLPGGVPGTMCVLSVLTKGGAGTVPGWRRPLGGPAVPEAACGAQERQPG